VVTPLQTGPPPGRRVTSHGHTHREPTAHARGLIVAIHDVSSATLAESRALRTLVRDVLGPVPVSLLVVPAAHGRARWSAAARSWLRWRADHGDELVLQVPDRPDPPGAGAPGPHPGLPACAADRGIRAGRAALAAEGLEVRGLIVSGDPHPSWLDAECAACGLEWWATRGVLRDPVGVAGMRLPSLSLGAPAAARHTLGPVVARVSVRALAGSPAVRLDLRPADLHHRRPVSAIGPLLTALAAQDRQAVRHRDLLAAGARR
jgi:hypothetical protein